MRVLIIFFVGMMFTLQSCEKDPVFESQICRPGNKPEITDTQNRNTPQLKGHWQLVNTQNFSNQVYLAYDSLTGRKPILKFLDEKQIRILGPINDCGNEYFTIGPQNGKNWLIFKNNPMPCTKVGGNLKWEEHYKKALLNSTCYNINQNQLIIQYFISKDKKGMLIYKKVKT